jgi:hypothetical protein
MAVVSTSWPREVLTKTWYIAATTPAADDATAIGATRCLTPRTVAAVSVISKFLRSIVCSAAGTLPQRARWMCRTSRLVARTQEPKCKLLSGITWKIAYLAAAERLGDHAAVILDYRRALALFRDLGNRYNEADTLTHLGDSLQAAGDPTGARTAWRHALTILTELRHPDAQQVRGRLDTPA